MLPARVWLPANSNTEPEDIFSSSLSVLYTDDTQNSHGIPGQSVTYNSPLFGAIKLGIPQHPDVEEGRKLFAHFLWNAGVVAADAIEVASTETGREREKEDGKVYWNPLYWNMRGKDILELGAGISHTHPSTQYTANHITSQAQRSLLSHAPSPMPKV